MKPVNAGLDLVVFFDKTFYFEIAETLSLYLQFWVFAVTECVFLSIVKVEKLQIFVPES